MKTFRVTKDMYLEAWGGDGVIFFKLGTHPEVQSIPIFGHEIKALVAALTDAAAWIADQVGEP